MDGAFSQFKMRKLSYFSLKSVQCASICSINSKCEVYNQDSFNCDEASASDLIGTLADSPTAKIVYIEQNLYKNNKGTSK